MFQKSDFVLMKRGHHASIGVTKNAVYTALDAGFTDEDINAFVRDLAHYANTTLPSYRAGVYAGAEKYRALESHGYHCTLYACAQKIAPGAVRLRGQEAQRGFVLELHAGKDTILVLDLLIDKDAFASEVEIDTLVRDWLTGLVYEGVL
jgi:hypothetical protein